jgi:hypothetical protein
MNLIALASSPVVLPSLFSEYHNPNIAAVCIAKAALSGPSSAIFAFGHGRAGRPPGRAEPVGDFLARERVFGHSEITVVSNPANCEHSHRPKTSPTQAELNLALLLDSAQRNWVPAHIRRTFHERFGCSRRDVNCAQG